MKRSNRKTQSGFSLLEVAMATAIYSMGMGSVSLLMLLAVQGTVDARDRSLASIHSAELAELILMQSDAVGHYVIEAGPAPANCGLGSDCSDAQLAAYHLADWRSGLVSNLPAGQGLVCRDATPDDGSAGEPRCDGAGSPVVKLFWAAPETAEAPAAGRVSAAVPLP